jgi:hypothetical protein
MQWLRIRRSKESSIQRKAVHGNQLENLVILVVVAPRSHERRLEE